MNRLTTIDECSQALAERKTAAVALIESSIDEIQHVNDNWNVFSNRLTERALIAAAASDLRRKNKCLLGPLDGVPIAIKDNIHLSGHPTFAGTRYDFSSSFTETATVAVHLEAAGAIIVGKCCMDEGALGASTNNPFTGQCHNPAHPGLTPGGSSGGSAAAVAANFVAASLGTDTLGSVRIPAAYCNLWGMKPTNGFTHLNGIVPLSPTLDSVGPLGHNASDLKLMLAAMIGMGQPGDDKQPAFEDLTNLRVGVIDAQHLADVEDDVRSAFETFVEKLATAGCVIKTMSLDQWNPGKLRHDGLLLSEVQASTALSDPLRDSTDRFSKPFHKMMAYGRSITAERLQESVTRMNAVKNNTLDCLNRHQVLLMPTTPQLAFPVNSDAPTNQADFTTLANVAGCPAVAFPIPIPDNAQRQASAQILGLPGSDFSLLSIAEKMHFELNGTD